MPAPSWQDTPQCQRCQELYPNQVLNSTFSSDTCGKLVSTCCPDQLGSTPQTAPLVNKSCRTLVPSAKAAPAPPRPLGASKVQPVAFVATKSASPSWCQWIPPTVHCNMSLHAVVAGVITPPTAICASWCVWVPSPSWQYTADCQRCGDGNVNAIQGCDTWCEWVSRPTWANTPGCEQCTTEQNQDGKDARNFTMTFVEQSNHISMRLHGGIGAGVQ